MRDGGIFSDVKQGLSVSGSLLLIPTSGHSCINVPAHGSSVGAS